jgi:MFS transporter, NNP family, nitrate/nitrite transporter
MLPWVVFGFALWGGWSFAITFLPEIGVRYRSDQLFALVALPGLLGAILRFPRTLANARSAFGHPAPIRKATHTWIFACLYVGTFGSFVGYSVSFPVLLKTEFSYVPVGVALLGPLAGAIARPLGSRAADRFGGARVTFWSFVAMTLAAFGVAYSLGARSFPSFLTTFLLLFVTTGIGNGSTSRMIPAIFRAEALVVDLGRGIPTGKERAEALARGRRATEAVLGFSSAIGALGGCLIPQAFAASIRLESDPSAAVVPFIGLYAICLTMTWWFYLRAGGLATHTQAFAEVKRAMMAVSDAILIGDADAIARPTTGQSSR